MKNSGGVVGGQGTRGTVEKMREAYAIHKTNRLLPARVQFYALCRSFAPCSKLLLQ